MKPFLIYAGRLVPPSLLLLGVCGSGMASAQEDERSWDLGIALGYGERSNPLVSGESIDINAVVDFSWYGERFFFDNGDFGLMLRADRRYSLNLVATVNNERNFYNYLTGSNFGLRNLVGIAKSALAPPGFTSTGEADPGAGSEEKQDDFLASIGLPETTGTEYVNRHTELPERDFAVNSGFEFLYISPWGDVQAQLLSDVSGTHDGQEAWLSWSHPWYTHSNEFTLTLGAEWKSSNLVSYYYGVRADESFPGRDPYAGGSGTNTFVRFAARHAFSEHWHLVGMVEREFLSSAISNSPIVDARHVDTFFAGLFYQF